MSVSHLYDECCVLSMPDPQIAVGIREPHIPVTHPTSLIYCHAALMPAGSLQDTRRDGTECTGRSRETTPSVQRRNFGALFSTGGIRVCPDTSGEVYMLLWCHKHKYTHTCHLSYNRNTKRHFLFASIRANKASSAPSSSSIYIDNESPRDIAQECWEFFFCSISLLFTFVYITGDSER